MKTLTLFMASAFSLAAFANPQVSSLKLVAEKEKSLFFTVGGMQTGDLVMIYKDASCQNEVSQLLISRLGEPLEVKDLGAGEHEFHARIVRTQVLSECSQASVKKKIL